ncbi:Choline dehydrogenase [Roseibacterium elongatum DSM 19469]|uniref:Choline dehydrogenase n=1 Tax=Roseicyclus elongatus DSM 19469 TaxID=1294273 RepID=W8SPZ6_9RHOB|nr:choline dehydrogenase [Roseibacterium elongatum]AHM04610.1 Choline dehydrogenase [Roseibacterium elongatum DSM 19469]
MQADYIVVGAGSAGCAIAYRLAEAGKQVIVLEHGGTDAGPFIKMPAALSYPMNMARYDWGYQTEPEPHMAGRRMACPRGKVIGGSSSINGMIYVRGHARDYDAWAEMGAQGWSYADVLPYFRRMENWHGDDGCGTWRGDDGPLHITRGRRDNPLFEAFIEAGSQAGYGRTEDYNGHRQEGFGAFEMTIWKGQRWSAADAYLKPALKRENCTLVRGLVERIHIEDGRATGVWIRRGGAEAQLIRANAEVVLTAGAINSPKLLMLSGIGPAHHLVEHGVPVVADRAGVGQNLQDHLELYIQYAARQPVSLAPYWSLWGKALVGTQWVLTRSGLGASNQFEACGFIRSRAGVEYPDIQFHFLPIAVRYDGSVSAAGHGFQAHVGPMRSKSRGRVALTSSDPAAVPSILFNYMSHEDDWRDFRKAIRLTREIFQQPAMQAFAGDELLPGADVASDEALDDVIRDHAESAYHPCGTCRMGRRDDPDAVVDPENRVIGVEGLRLADSSIFPQVTNGNTNAPSIMVGEKAADHILGRDPLPRDNRGPWIAPDWEHAQRQAPLPTAAQ